jgi:D-3-phosphoglycerate dehydrogenase
MKKNILITQSWPVSYVTEMDTYVKRLEDAGFNVIVDSREKSLTEKELIEILPGIFAHISGMDQYTAKAMDAGDKLKIICRIGVGVENVDISAAGAGGEI